MYAGVTGENLQYGSTAGVAVYVKCGGSAPVGVLLMSVYSAGTHKSSAIAENVVCHRL